MQTETTSVDEFLGFANERQAEISSELGEIREMQYNVFYARLLCIETMGTPLLDLELNARDMACREMEFAKAPSHDENSSLLLGWECLNDAIMKELVYAHSWLSWSGLQRQLQIVAYKGFNLRRRWMCRRSSFATWMTECEGYLRSDKPQEALALRSTGLTALRATAAEVMAHSGLNETLARN